MGPRDLTVDVAGHEVVNHADCLRTGQWCYVVADSNAGTVADNQRDLPAREGATMIPKTTGTTQELADGNEMPLLGLGVCQVPDGPECVNAVRWALEAGYPHIDTAQAYGNEPSVGAGVEESGAVAAKCSSRPSSFPWARTRWRKPSGALSGWGSTRSTCTSCTGRRTAPSGVAGDGAAGELGYARSVGVPNFSAAERESVAAVATVMPAVGWHRERPAKQIVVRRGALRRHRLKLA